MPIYNLLGFILITTLLSCSPSPRYASPETPTKTTSKPSTKKVKSDGIASWYGPGFQGRKTANGEKFDMHALTAAHKELPFGTMVEVTNLDNGRKVVVRINDRGPFVKGRVIDLSKKAAQSIGMIEQGHAPVKLRILP